MSIASHIYAVNWVSSVSKGLLRSESVLTKEYIPVMALAKPSESNPVTTTSSWSLNTGHSPVGNLVCPGSRVVSLS